VFSDHQEIRAISVTELDKGVSAVINEVESGKRVIVTKHGLPVAVFLSIDDGFEALVAGSESFALLRREAREQLERGETVALPPWRSEPG
jgi:prevent-host-death family protein